MNSAGTEYDSAYELVLSSNAGEYYCYQIFSAAWSIEWDVNSEDVSDSAAAFYVLYEDWTADVDNLCDGSNPGYDSNDYISGDDMTVDAAATCAHTALIEYTPE